MPKSRTSRFADAAVSAEAPTHDDRVTSDERLRRRLAANASGSPFNAESVEDYRRKRQASEKAYEVREDFEVATGAVAAVTQSADGWQARWVLVEHEGAVVVRSLHLEPEDRTTPSGGITTNLLRELSPGRAVAAAAARLSGGLDPQSWEDLRLIHAQRDASEFGPPADESRGPGRPRLSDDHLRAVALAYLEELKGGPGVLKRLGRRFDREWQTMRDQVRIARRRGYLTDAPKAGRKGAMPGPRLLEHDDEQREEA
ncbi:hypothetical protein [Kribbella deserti]|uniref:Uncharacterized protein n=1 Tax=Kribbella deserti TaxID=1926257 RepID=A0ABV6QF89_9ACTN